MFLANLQKRIGKSSGDETSVHVTFSSSSSHRNLQNLIWNQGTNLVSIFFWMKTHKLEFRGKKKMWQHILVGPACQPPRRRTGARHVPARTVHRRRMAGALWQKHHLVRRAVRISKPIRTAVAPAPPILHFPPLDATKCHCRCLCSSPPCRLLAPPRTEFTHPWLRLIRLQLQELTAHQRWAESTGFSPFLHRPPPLHFSTSPPIFPSW